MRSSRPLLAPALVAAALCLVPAGLGAQSSSGSLAIHGTNKPELVLEQDPENRRVSHGCIRLTNEDARILYHLVDIGTPVLIY